MRERCVRERMWDGEKVRERIRECERENWKMWVELENVKEYEWEKMWEWERENVLGRERENVRETVTYRQKLIDQILIDC